MATASMWAIDQLSHSHESYIRHIIQVSESDDRGHMKRIFAPLAFEMRASARQLNPSRKACLRVFTAQQPLKPFDNPFLFFVSNTQVPCIVCTISEARMYKISPIFGSNRRFNALSYPIEWVGHQSDSGCIASASVMCWHAQSIHKITYLKGPS